MKSMTGFGKASAENDGRKVTIELKAVNHRYLDLSIKLPKLLNAAEDTIRKTLQARFSRGHIDAYVTYENTRNDSITLSLKENLAEQYLKIANTLNDNYNINNDFTATSMLRFPDVVVMKESDEDEVAISELVRQAVEGASDKLNEMREFEGQKLKKDCQLKISNIQNLVNEIKKRAPLVVGTYATKLKERITEALSGVQIDEARLLNEVAFFSDKVSIDEEITRLNSHCQHALELFEAVEPVGRSLDFLIQEFNREANTIGSKSNDIEVTNLALALKNEIEKIREQVQNAE